MHRLTEDLQLVAQDSTFFYFSVANSTSGLVRLILEVFILHTDKKKK